MLSYENLQFERASGPMSPTYSRILPGCVTRSLKYMRDRVTCICGQLESNPRTPCHSARADRIREPTTAVLATFYRPLNGTTVELSRPAHFRVEMPECVGAWACITFSRFPCTRGIRQANPAEHLQGSAGCRLPRGRQLPGASKEIFRCCL